MKNELLPLSIGQKLVAYAGQLYPNTPVNNIGGLILFEEKLDPGILARAIEICVQRNDALRIRICRKRRPFMKMEILLSDILQQYVSEPQKVEVVFHDFSRCTDEEMEEAVLSWNSIPIDIFADSLYEFKIINAPDGRVGVFAKLHHIITDAWNSTLLSKEIIEIYHALLRSEELPEPLNSFLDYLKSEESYLKSPQYKADKEFWMNVYETKPVPTRLRERGKRSKTGITMRFNENIGIEKSRAINDFCVQNKISPVSFFTFLTCICLSRFTGSQEVNLASPVMFRSTLNEKRTCGPMVNFQLIRFFLDNNKAFIDSCMELDRQRLLSMRHIRFPNLHLLRAIVKKHLVSDLFDTFVSFSPARIETKEDLKFESRWLHSGYFANPFSLYITDIDNTGEYNLQYEYHIDNYSTEHVKEIHRNLMAFLNYGIENPYAAMKDVFQTS